MTPYVSYNCKIRQFTNVISLVLNIAVLLFWAQTYVVYFEQRLRVFLLYFSSFFIFLLLFVFMMEKDGKTCLNTEKDEFDQQTACEAPFCWWKYTTDLDQFKCRLWTESYHVKSHVTNLEGMTVGLDRTSGNNQVSVTWEIIWILNLTFSYFKPMSKHERLHKTFYVLLRRTNIKKNKKIK